MAAIEYSIAPTYGYHCRDGSTVTYGKMHLAEPNLRWEHQETSYITAPWFVNVIGKM